MFSFYPLPRWEDVADTVDKFVDALSASNWVGSGVTGPKKKLSSNSSVSTQEVPHWTKTTLPEVTEDEVTWRHDSSLSGAWGITHANALLQYTVLRAKDGGFVPQFRAVKVGASIRLKKETGFKELKEFAPLYAILQGQYAGDVVGFSRAMSNRVVPEYNAFGTVRGVLLHELVHYGLAKKFAKILIRNTYAEIPGRSHASPSDAAAAFVKAADTAWKEWRGQLPHEDERFVWEQECKFYVKEYEAAGKPGYGK